MSKRKPNSKKPKGSGASVTETLEQNAPHDVAIQSVRDVQDASIDETADDAETLELPVVDLPPMAEHVGVDLEVTVDVRDPLEVDALQRDDAAAEAAGEAAPAIGAAAVDQLLAEIEGTTEEPSAAPDADEDEGADSITTSATDRERTNLKGLVEALVFATDKPIKVGELARLTDAAPKLIRVLLLELAEDYKPRGIQLSEVAGGYLFRTNVRYGSFVRELTQQKPVRLSRAQLEALAILAYRQPITRPEIDEIRGVDSGPVLKMLLERELVRILGKRDEVGRPLIYGTTPEFLEFFGLKSLKDLPNLREFTELTDESHAIAEKELGESWRGPDGGNADAVAAEPAERGEIEAAHESESSSEDDEERDAEEEKIALESVVEHVSVDDPESGFETTPVEAEDDDRLEADGKGGSSGDDVPEADGSEDASTVPEADEHD